MSWFILHLLILLNGQSTTFCCAECALDTSFCFPTFSMTNPKSYFKSATPEFYPLMVATPKTQLVLDLISSRDCQPACQRECSLSCLALSQKRTLGSQEATISAKTHFPWFLRLTTWKCRHPHVSWQAVHFEPTRWGYFCFLGIFFSACADLLLNQQWICWFRTE